MRVLGVSSATETSPSFAQQILLAHRTQDRFAIDVTTASSQMCCDSALAIRRHLKGNCFDCFVQLRTRLFNRYHVTMPIKLCACNLCEATHPRDGQSASNDHLLSANQLRHNAHPRAFAQFFSSSTVKAFFKKSFSIVSRPTIRSSSATRACSV